MNHYSGELPGYVPNQEKASDIASDEVITESPHHQTPNQELASSIDYVLIHDNIHSESDVPEQSVLEEDVFELDVPKQSVPKQVIYIQTPTTNTISEPETFTNDQPSSSSLTIQLVSPAKTNVSSPPTLFLDSTILADVCENIFQELNNLVQARNNLIHEDIYEKQWKTPKRTCLD